MTELNQQMLRDRLNRAETALERCERMAIASRYASAVMHEVNNCLEAITNLVYLTKLGAAIPEEVIGNMVSIDQQLSIVGRVTRQALSFHRDVNEMKDIDLVDLAQAALKLHADRILRHRVIVETRFADSAVVRVHQSEILQVISNLLLNALDAVPTGAGRLSVQVTSDHFSVGLVISDNGQGISDDLAKDLFEPYVTSKPTGTGLGLWLSKRIIARHKGTVRFTTSQLAGKNGSSFYISLPASISA